MGKVSEETLTKMQEYVTARNNPQRLSIVELVANYVLDDLPKELDREEALMLARFHLSTDRGMEDLQILYPEALANLPEAEEAEDDGT
jgi:hypothetical protein